MTYVLALDTTSDHGSIALARDGDLIEEVAVDAPEGFGHILFAEIAMLLERHSLRFRDIGCFAAASGPGSFTGVRIGLTAVKGLADAADRKVVAVSNLQAVAWFGSSDLRAAWVDARRGEIYGAVYNDQLKLVQEEQAAPHAQWSAALPHGAVEITQERPLARAIASIAWERFKRGAAQDPSEIDANYVRRSDAEMMWRDPA